MIHLWNLILLDGLLGLIIEESFFGAACFRSLTARTGPAIGIAGTALLFAHTPSNQHFVQWLASVATGIAFGLIPS